MSKSTQLKLYSDTVAIFQQQARYASMHAGQYATGIVDLAAGNKALSFALPGSTTPVVEWSTAADGRGYFMELADQSSGGAASFTVLVRRHGTPVTTCTGPAPLCKHGHFTFPASAYKPLVLAQHTLYDETVAIIRWQVDHAAANAGRYEEWPVVMAADDPSLAFVLSTAVTGQTVSTSPVAIFVTSPQMRVFALQMNGVSADGAAQFTAVLSGKKAPVLTCTGARPLCTNGKFSLPSDIGLPQS